MQQYITFTIEPRVETDAHGRVSYTTYDYYSPDLRIPIPHRSECESDEDYESQVEHAKELAQGRRITLPTPFPRQWKDIRKNIPFAIRVENIAVQPNAHARFRTYMGMSASQGGKIYYQQKQCMHPDLAPVPWSPDAICYDPDYEGPQYPPGVEDRGDTDPEWRRMAQQLTGLSFDNVPHWTLRFKTPEIQREWASKPLPPFNHELLTHPDISDIVLVYDNSRAAASHMATAEIMRALLIDYVADLEEALQSAEQPARKRRAL